MHQTPKSFIIPRNSLLFWALRDTAILLEVVTIMEIDPLHELSNEVVKLYEELTSASLDVDTTEAWLQHLGLKFPACVEALTQQKAVDRQTPAPE